MDTGAWVQEAQLLAARFATAEGEVHAALAVLQQGPETCAAASAFVAGVSSFREEVAAVSAQLVAARRCPDRWLAELTASNARAVAALRDEELLIGDVALEARLCAARVEEAMAAEESASIATASPHPARSGPRQPPSAERPVRPPTHPAVAAFDAFMLRFGRSGECLGWSAEDHAVFMRCVLRGGGPLPHAGPSSEQSVLFDAHAPSVALLQDSTAARASASNAAAGAIPVPCGVGPSARGAGSAVAVPDAVGLYAGQSAVEAVLERLPHMGLADVTQHATDYAQYVDLLRAKQRAVAAFAAQRAADAGEQAMVEHYQQAHAAALEQHAEAVKEQQRLRRHAANKAKVSEWRRERTETLQTAAAALAGPSVHVSAPTGGPHSVRNEAELRRLAWDERDRLRRQAQFERIQSRQAAIKDDVAAFRKERAARAIVGRLDEEARLRAHGYPLPAGPSASGAFRSTARSSSAAPAASPRITSRRDPSEGAELAERMALSQLRDAEMIEARKEQIAARRAQLSAPQPPVVTPRGQRAAHRDPSRLLQPTASAAQRAEAAAQQRTASCGGRLATFSCAPRTSGLSAVQWTAGRRYML